MEKFLLLITSIILLLSPMAFALNITDIPQELQKQYLESKILPELKSNINSQLIKLPSIIKTIIGNENILTSIKYNNTSMNISFVLKKGIIESATLSNLDKPTLTIMIKEDFVKSLQENKQTTFQQAIKNKDIVLIPHRFKTRLKLSLINIATNLIDQK